MAEIESPIIIERSPENSLDAIEAARKNAMKRPIDRAVKEILKETFEKKKKVFEMAEAATLGNQDETPAVDEPVETVDEPVVIAATEEDFDDAALAKKVTRNVNGHKVTKTLQEWLDAASKVEQADSYLSQAAQQLSTKKREAEIILTKEEQDKQQEEYLAMVKAIQSGTEADAMAALQKLQNLSAVKLEKKLQITNETEQGRLAFMRVLDANKDLATDPMLKNLAVSIEGDLARENVIFDPNNQVRNFELRFAEAWKRTRAWYEKNQNATLSDQKKQELIDKKKALASVQSNNSRTVSKPKEDGVKTFKTHEEYNEYVAQQLKQRNVKRGFNINREIN